MELHQRFLLKDYEVNSLLLGTYVSMRLAALAGSLPLLGFLLAQGGGGTTELITKASVLALMLLIASSVIRVVGAINRNIFARCIHLAWVEDQLGEFGFYSYWTSYAKRHSRDTSSFAFVIACRMINIGIVGYVIDEVFRALSPIGPIPTAVAVGGVLMSGIFNERYIRKHLSESGFLKRMEVDLAQARRGEIRPVLVPHK